MLNNLLAQPIFILFNDKKEIKDFPIIFRYNENKIMVWVENWRK